MKLSGVLAMTLLSPVAFGQSVARPGAQYMRLFDPKTVITVEGEVTKVERAAHKAMKMTAVHVTLKARDGEYVVHLGPAWFIDNQDLQVAVGDRVVATGSKVTVGGVLSLIAIEVKRGDEVLQLRDADGTPKWVAWRRS